LTEWWEKPYPTGKPLSVPGFPRPLYPPDAVGYKPSVDGTDVEAYKRTLWRLGRWGAPPHDDSYSNDFSHGTGGKGNVGTSGMAGFQRQCGINPSGYVGTSTFQALITALIPEGLPNAGKYGMDANAQNLLAMAWQQFNPPVKLRTVRDAALEEAVSYLGYKENPPDSNNTVFGQWYGLNYNPWCAMFVTYCFEVNSVGASPSFAKAKNYSYVPYMVDDARNGRNGLKSVSDPKPGDLVAYDWQGDGTFDHVGIFEYGTNAQWNAIEGNTSMNNNSNGGEVMRRARFRNEIGNVVFINVAEP
jgi:CHAP domain